MLTTTAEEHFIGPLRSDFWRLRVPPERIPEIDWNSMGRRVMIDVGEGIVTWMNPSASHKRRVSASDKVVSLAGALLKIPVRDMLDLCLKVTGDPKNIRIEPDAAFYVGKKAEGLLAARDRVAFEAGTPPDLVVEVEVTHFDEDKPRHYADLGVTEMWRAV